MNSRFQFQSSDLSFVRLQSLKHDPFILGLGFCLYQSKNVTRLWLWHLEKESSKDFGISNAAKKALTSDKRPSEAFCVVFLKNYPKFTRKHLIWSPFLSFKLCDFFWNNYFNKYLETVSFITTITTTGTHGKRKFKRFSFLFCFYFSILCLFYFFFYSDIFFFLILFCINFPSWLYFGFFFLFYITLH